VAIPWCARGDAVVPGAGAGVRPHILVAQGRIH
jgi:hypothetical protein